MATAPTRAFGVTPAVGWANTSRPKTSPAFDVQAGDLIVLVAFTEDAAFSLAAPTWTGAGTWALLQSVVVSNYCTAYLFATTATATQAARTISMDRTGGASGGQWSFYASGWRNHGGLGVTGKANASGAPALTLATSANSAVVVGNSDWTASSGTRTWRTVNGSPLTETSFGGTAGVTYMCYSGYSPDTGPAGNIAFGMTAPSGQKYSIVGVEILGTTGSGPVDITATLTGAGTLTASVVPAFGKQATLAGTSTLTGVMAPGFVKPGTLGGAGALSAIVAPGVTRAATLAGTAALTVALQPAVAITAQSSGAGTLTGSLSASSDRAWDASFTTAGALMASLAPVVTVTATLAGTNTLAVAMVPAINATADMGVEATLTATVSTGTTWDAGFAGEAILTVTIEKGRALHTVFPAEGTLAGVLTPDITITALFTAEGTLTEHPQEPNMAIPSPDWDLVTLKWAGTYLDGTPCTGRLKFAYNGTATFMLDDDLETPLSIYTQELSVQLTTKVVLFEGAPREVGYAEIQVPASNDPDITGAGGTYTCTELLDRSAGRPPFKFVADINAEDRIIWLNKVEPVA